MPARLCHLEPNVRRAWGQGALTPLLPPSALRREPLVAHNGCPLCSARVEDSFSSHRSLCNPRGLVRGHTARCPRLDTCSFRQLPTGSGLRRARGILPLASPYSGAPGPNRPRIWRPPIGDVPLPVSPIVLCPPCPLCFQNPELLPLTRAGPKENRSAVDTDERSRFIALPPGSLLAVTLTSGLGLSVRSESYRRPTSGSVPVFSNVTPPAPPWRSRRLRPSSSRRSGSSPAFERTSFADLAAFPGP